MIRRRRRTRGTKRMMGGGMVISRMMLCPHLTSNPSILENGVYFFLTKDDVMYAFDF